MVQLEDDSARMPGLHDCRFGNRCMEQAAERTSRLIAKNYEQCFTVSSFDSTLCFELLRINSFNVNRKVKPSHGVDQTRADFPGALPDESIGKN